MRGELVRRYSREEENRQLEKPHLTLKDFEKIRGAGARESAGCWESDSGEVNEARRVNAA